MKHHLTYRSAIKI